MALFQLLSTFILSTLALILYILDEKQDAIYVLLVAILINL